MKPRVLVTSAAGHTGAVAVTQLLEDGFPVRAFVRRQDPRSERLEAAGAEIFVGDLFDMRDLREALVDVQRAYHVPPFAPNLLHGAMLFALAAEEAQLGVVALMSGWNPIRFTRRSSPANTGSPTTCTGGCRRWISSTSTRAWSRSPTSSVSPPSSTSGCSCFLSGTV